MDLKWWLILALVALLALKLGLQRWRERHSDDPRSRAPAYREREEEEKVRREEP